MRNKPPIKQKQGAYIVKYPVAVAYAEMQQSIAWMPSEIPVEDDIQGVLVDNTESENHATTYALKLFTKYELFAGQEYWGGVIAKRYPRPCIQRMANAFAFAELNMHAPFYNKLNEALNLDTEDFYNDYINDPVLSSRMDFLDSLVSGKDELLSVAVFSLVEGAVLYSSFAFFKHFRHGGKNKYKNLVSGISFSVRDENLHSEAGAWLYRTHRSELNLNDSEVSILENNIIEAARTIVEHEEHIIDNMFSKGPIHGITAVQLKHFVHSRIDLCLTNLGIKGEWKAPYNPIAEWFYDDINSVKLHDFFDTTGNEYNRRWNIDKFVWPESLKEIVIE